MCLSSVDTLLCTFDSDWCGMTQDTEDVFDWTRTEKKTPSSRTGPTAGDGGYGFYAFIETSHPRKEGDFARHEYIIKTLIVVTI